MSVDRLLSIYGQPVQSWPGEEDVDAEAKANWEAMNPHLAQAKAPKLRPDEAYRGTFLPFRETLDGRHEWAVPGFLMDVADSARAIKDTSGLGLGPMPRPSQYSPEVFEQILGHGMAGALTGITGNIPRLLTKPTPGTTELGIFGGRSAKTANQEMLAKAEQMAADGAPREDIWKATGWFQGPDSKWRFEIDDSQAKYTPDTPVTHLPDMVRHDPLFQAYPDMGGIGATRTKAVDFRGEWALNGYFDPDKNILGMHDELGTKTGRSTALHEMQHAVQEREGFASGANPGRFPPVKEDRAMLTDANVLARMASGAGGDMDAAKDRFRTMFKRDPALGAESVALSGEAPDAILARRDALLDPYEAYRRTAGETEARAVQARANLTPEERLARPPWMDYDVPESQQIVRFRNEGMSSAEKAPLDMSPEARLARAREMGFDTDRVWYHGTRSQQPFDAFELGRPTHNNLGLLGNVETNRHAVFLSDNRDVSGAYGSNVSGYHLRGEPVDLERIRDAFVDSLDAFGDRDVWMRAKHGREPWRFFDGELGERFSQWARENGIEAVRFKEAIEDAAGREVEGTTVAVLDPANIRSVDAAFDIAKTDSPQIMASMDVPGGGAAGAASAQAAQQQRMVDALGYYSAAVEAAKGIKQARGTPEQMLTQIRKAGVRDAELEATGLATFRDEPVPGKPGEARRVMVPADWLAGKAVTRDQIVEHLEKNKIVLQEAVYGVDEAAVRDAIADRRLGGRFADQGPLDQADIAKQARAEIAEGRWNSEREPKWSDYSLDPDNPTYRETVLHLPTGEMSGQDLNLLRRERESLLQQASAARNLASRATTDAERVKREAVVAAAESRVAEIDRQLSPVKEAFRSGHFDEPNIVGHMMTSETRLPFQGDLNEIGLRMAAAVGATDPRSMGSGALTTAIKKGAVTPEEANAYGRAMGWTNAQDLRPKVFTLDQIQSDWGQKLRDGGVRDEAKIADLKAKLNDARATFDRVAVEDGIEFLRRNRDAMENIGRDEPKFANQVISDLRAYIRLRDTPIDEHKAAVALEKRLLDLSRPIELYGAELKTAEAGVSGHPLVNTTDQWTNVVLRRAIRQAAESGADYIAVPTGDTVLSYNPGDAHGMNTFYNQIVPKNLKNLLTKIDKKSPPPQRIDTLDSPSGATGLGEGFTLFPLTEKVKKEVMEGGQPLFAKGGSVAGPALRRLARKSARIPRSVDDALDR